jgi:hypothetical protein
MAASGAAFAAVVFGQMANAFACRSATLPPWRLGWTTNRLLLGAVAVELLALAGFLAVPAVADLLGHAIPLLAALLVALGAVPAVLVADALHQASRARRRDAGPGLAAQSASHPAHRSDEVGDPSPAAAPDLIHR